MFYWSKMHARVTNERPLDLFLQVKIIVLGSLPYKRLDEPSWYGLSSIDLLLPTSAQPFVLPCEDKLDGPEEAGP